MYHKSSLLLLVAFWLLAGCNSGEAPPSALEPTPTLRPTPTLHPALPTSTPPAPASDGVAQATPAPTVTSTPTPTPEPSQRIALAQTRWFEGDYAAAAGQFEAGLGQRDELSPADQAQALLALGEAYLLDGRDEAAANTLRELLAMTAAEALSEAYFFLGQASERLGDVPGALAAYHAYLEANPEMGAYVNSMIAALHQAQGDSEGAVTALEAALSGPAHRLKQIKIRQQLAQLYLAAEKYEAAVAQFDAIQALAVTENTRGQVNYQAGTAEILAGNEDAGYARYQAGVVQYPRAYESYLGLVALVEAGYGVDAAQRGLVDFYAHAYEPAVAAFERVIAENPATYPGEMHLYLAWSYEGLGNLGAALAQLDKYANVDPAGAAIERAKMLARNGDGQGAIDAYLGYVEAFPEGEQAPFAAWWAAVLTEQLGDVETAVARYLFLADHYDRHEDAPEALFRAGWLKNQAGDRDAAATLWTRAVIAYPGSEYGAASLVWLFKTRPLPAGEDLGTGDQAGPAAAYPGPGDASEGESGGQEVDQTAALEAAIQTIARRQSASYYVLRARDVLSDVRPFAPPLAIDIPPADETAAQSEVESWLRQRLELEPDADISSLSPSLAADPRLIVGEKLWRLGLWLEARDELEALRRDVSGDALQSYQLALFFRDLGLYRSSILAAERVLVLTGETVFTAPRFLGRLAYPVYYADLILPLAEQYTYDPLLQFSLVRQESLFESFARSGAAAQGLSQVIPDTGAFIAQRLSWPEYDNEDLYKPYVGLAFGAYYLSQQLRAFDGDVHAALAAYNAGPGNAARWVEQAGRDYDLFVETVDFAETRLYVERIYVGYVIYRALYGR